MGSRVLIAALAALFPGLGHGAEASRPACRASDFTIARGFQISPATGQHPLTIRLTNRGSTACTLFGYPSLRFIDRRGTIPFAIRHGGDMMVTTRRPTPVVVRPGRSVFVLVNKYRCDLGSLRNSRTVRLGFPGETSRRLVLAVPRYGPTMDYCGKGDAGSTIATSPFEPTLAAAMRHL
jgi:Protein of unknown function (DUF4232)